MKITARVIDTKEEPTSTGLSEMYLVEIKKNLQNPEWIWLRRHQLEEAANQEDAMLAEFYRALLWECRVKKQDKYLTGTNRIDIERTNEIDSHVVTLIDGVVTAPEISLYPMTS